ncbi:MAG: hypothetical protein ACE5KY_03030 [Candidatus Tectimicrobiota bacterium]
MSRWVYIGLAYGLAGGVLVGYFAYLVAALRRNRQHLETLLARPATARNPTEETT